MEVPGFGLGVIAAVWLGYFVFLKASRYRTLGYVLGGARIVNYRGERPGIPLRDKFASTYVIRHTAVPAGWGRLRYRTYTFSGMTFMFREVERMAKG